MKVEIECRSFDEINQVMAHGGADRIMLDNFSVEDTKKAVELIDHKFETESSGGITYDTLRDYAECGVDFISVRRSPTLLRAGYVFQSLLTPPYIIKDTQ